MNNYVIYLLLTIFIAEIFGCAPASEQERNAWKEDHEKMHINAINSIINSVVDKVKKYADEIGTTIAQNCYNDSKQLLLDLSSNGENEVKRCIEIADSKANSDHCCYEVQSIIGEESIKIALSLTHCIDNAKLLYKV